MRERRYGDTRTRSPPFPRGRDCSPLASRHHRETSPMRHHRREVSPLRHRYSEVSPLRNRHREVVSPLRNRHREVVSPLRNRQREVSPLRYRDHEVSPPSHRYDGVKEQLSSRYLSGVSRVGSELSPPIRRRREFTPSPPPPPPASKLEHSPPPYHLGVKEPVHSQPLTDSRITSITGLCTDRWMEGVGREGYEGSRYEADTYTGRYGDHSLGRKLGSDERYGDSASTKFHWKHLLDEKQAAAESEFSKRSSNSERACPGGNFSEIDVDFRPASMRGNDRIRNRNFPGYLGPSSVVSDRYGFSSGSSVAGLGLDRDGTWKYDNLSPREPSRELSKGEERLKFDYVDMRDAVSTGQTHALVYPYGSRDRFSGYLEDTGHDKYGQIPPARSSYEELLDSSLAENSPREKVGREYAYTDGRRNEDSDFNSRSDKHYYENLDSVREKYGLQGALKTSPVEYFSDRIEGADNSGGEFSRGSTLMDKQNYVSGESYMEEQDEEYRARATRLRHSEDEYLDYEPSSMVEDDGFAEGDGFGEHDGSWSYGDTFGSFSLSEHDKGLSDAEWSSQRRLTEGELGSVGPSEQAVKRKHGFDKRRLSYNFEAELPQNVTCDLRDDQGLINDNANGLYGRLQYGRFKMAYDSHSNKRRALAKDYMLSDDISKTMKRNWKKPVAQPVRDIKKRLGRVPQRNGQMSCPWVRARLGQARLNDEISLGSQEVDTLETVADNTESSANHNLVAAKTEPPQDSEEFAPLVNGAFLKFVKLLNENPAQRRKYADQGRSGILKCGICGRKSKEFTDTLSLAMHAFTTRATGFQAEHMGLHKAICALMGWNSAPGPNGTWVKQPLPDAEALALRQDLIIWPPMVIIHNSSIANPYPDGRVILGVEEIQAILREMGFGGDKTKVMRGKPANQSIMVASFHGTFSGLWEAESLHKHFIKKAQGRIEFDQISSNQKRLQGTGNAPEDKVSVLFGYLGIAEDLEQLDFEMKKRCVVKSRKEIEEIMDVQLKAVEVK